MLARRYHPDNPETGDIERFLLLKRAHEILANPEKRANYEANYQLQRAKPIRIFELKEFLNGIGGEGNRRMGILCLLYNQRRLDPNDPGLSLLEFEHLMSFPREHLLFTFWFLKEKEYVRAEHNGDYVVTAKGADYVEANLPSHHVLYRLLRSSESEAGESLNGDPPSSEHIGGVAEEAGRAFN
jgi:curved DNA-binding protein CbpA